MKITDALPATPSQSAPPVGEDPTAFFSLVQSAAPPQKAGKPRMAARPAASPLALPADPQPSPPEIGRNRRPAPATDAPLDSKSASAPDQVAMFALADVQAATIAPMVSPVAQQMVSESPSPGRLTVTSDVHSDAIAIPPEDFAANTPGAPDASGVKEDAEQPAPSEAPAATVAARANNTKSERVPPQPVAEPLSVPPPARVAEQTSLAAAPASASLALSASPVPMRHLPTMQPAKAPALPAGADAESPSHPDGGQRQQAYIPAAEISFSIAQPQAGSFRSEALVDTPSPLELPGEVAEVDRPAEVPLPDMVAGQSATMADVVISLSDAAAIDVTLGAHSQDSADRLLAETAELKADLAALGTEVEAIRVELRAERMSGERMPDAGAGRFGWNGHGTAGDHGMQSSRHFGRQSADAGAAIRADAAAIGKVDRYA